ncbi:MAG: hypothetical protein NT166_01825 [Candidatus Aminicenantes bacterium]|nr:hypothetical protein [Candidatus Aminicenantes bacterium]
MDDKIRSEILTEAERIGDNLLTIAHRDENGMSWNITTIEKDNSLTAYKLEDIFTGVSGVALFLIELYKVSQKEKYLDAAGEGARWLDYQCRREPSAFYSFLNGRMGVSYTFLKMAETTKENRYLQRALSIAEDCLDFLNDSRLVSFWLNGASGTILGLLHLHCASGEKWLLEKMEPFIRYLLENSHPGPKGVYWDRSNKNINGLCGFGNGAAGIGFTLLELGRYFNNEAFYWLAQQAFLYESCFYDESIQNWRDLRKVFHKYEDYKAHEAAYLEGNLDFFTRGGDVNYWAHGAAGIGLTRLRAFELLKKPIYEQEAKNAIARTMRQGGENEPIFPMFTLSEGETGNAELFLQSAAIFNDPYYLTLAEAIAVKTLAYRKEHNYYPSGLRFDNRAGNSSFFRGDPGIGYFYLRVLEPQRVPSILLPVVGGCAAGGKPPTLTLPYISISLPGIKKMVLNRYFKRSIALAETLLPRQLDDFFKQDEGGQEEKHVLKNRFNDFLRLAILSLPVNQREYMSEIAGLEMEIKKMDEGIPSHNLLYIKERLQRRGAEKWQALGAAEILDLSLKLDADVRLHACQWDWDLKKTAEQWLKNIGREPQSFFVLLKAGAKGVTESILSSFAYVILVEFRESKKVRDAFPSIIDSFGEISAEEKSFITAEIISQIKEMLSAGILVNSVH